MTNTDAALAAYDAKMAAGANHAQALAAAAEVLGMPVVAAFNLLLGNGLSFEFVRNESWKNKEALVLVRK